MTKTLTQVVLIVLASVTMQSQTPTFSSRVKAVRVDVLVTDNGQPVRGLGPADFDIRDNGVLQRVDFVSFEQIPLNLVLAFDVSDSVVAERLQRLRMAASATLRGLTSRDQSALVTFSHVVHLGARLSPDAAAVQSALTRVSDGGSTSLVDGVYAGMQVGESDAGRELLVIFSDGLDTASWLPASAVIDAAKRSDLVAYAVSVRSPAKPEFLRELTSTTGGQLFEIEKTENLESIFVNILQEFRQRYLVSYTPTGVAASGWHKLDVRVKRGGTVKARPGYQS